MSSTIINPEQCPVCGSTALRSSQLRYSSEQQNPPNRMSYRCDNDHVFYIDVKTEAASG
ncbi:MAG: hypothetical protein JOZ10_18265 [Acidobacteria bacterium]|nr:hypothetical protein [Acidobacteriota bacterium]MBV9146673.1 hypothetical protein [Acidobacteriota bacterium]